MGHQGRYGDIDYAKVTKTGLIVGVALFAAGVLGEIVAHALFAPVPEWEVQLFFTLEVLGILIGLFVPIVYGIVLPLTE